MADYVIARAPPPGRESVVDPRHYNTSMIHGDSPKQTVATDNDRQKQPRLPPPAAPTGKKNSISENYIVVHVRGWGREVWGGT